MKILITYAVKGELDEGRFEHVAGNEIRFCRTGIGKAKSAYSLTRALTDFQPDLVVNMGTVGTLNHLVGDIFICRRFVDRDMLRIKNLGLECEIDSSELLEAKGLCSEWGRDGICNTGDSFLTESAGIVGDVVDMEAYAQALVCSEMKVPFVAVKYVTDIIGQNSVKHWEDKLEDARLALGRFAEDYILK